VTSTGLIVAAAVLIVGTAAGLWRRRFDGRLRPARRSAPAASAATYPSAVANADLSAAANPDSGAVVNADSGADAGPSAVADVDPSAAGERIDAGLLAALGVESAQATLLQFSSAFCAPCRAVRRVSSEVAALLPGVRHVEVDAESHLEAVRALGIWRTPTLLVLDADGRVAKRATGVPAKPQLIAVLGEILPAA